MKKILTAFLLMALMSVNAEEKKDTPNPALRVKDKLLAVLKIIVKYQDK